MLGAHDVGRRVSVRRRVQHGLTDVVGHLLGAADGSLTVLRRDGEVVELDAASVTAAKVVPPAPVRPGWAVPPVSPEDMQRICWSGWPAREHEMIGDWALRAHGGVTGRANSAMAVGDPGRPLAAAVEAVRGWYADRGLPPLLQLPLADPAGPALPALGWARLHVTVVQVAPVAPVAATLAADVPPTGPAATDGFRATVEGVPSAAWLSLMHDLDPADPGAHVAILTGPERVGFATVRRGGEPVGIGRVSVEGGWAGITSVDVAPAARRQGVGRAVMGVLLAWAQEHGAAASYLQVRAGNAAALRLYAGLGYATHHPYAYWGPGDAEGAGGSGSGSGGPDLPQITSGSGS